MDNVFFYIGMIIIAAALVGLIARLLKQPLIPAYIIAGIIAVPAIKIMGIEFGSTQEIMPFLTVLADIGIAFLLFIVGLELDLKKLKDIGSVVTLGTLLQFAILFGIGYAGGILLGFSALTNIYLGLIIAFSSTMVIIKLLSDKAEIDTLHGRIVIGMLLAQDVLAVLAITILHSASNFETATIFQTLVKGFLLVLAAWMCSNFFFPKLFKFAAKSQEFLFILSLSVLFVFAILFDIAGFSLTIGAFVAGIALANLSYHHEISGKIKSLKDFFLVLFFISIGAQFVPSSFHWLPFIIIFLVIVIAKPLISIIIISIFGYKKRTATLAGLSLGQVSEFSIILIVQGIALSHVTQDFYSLAILLTLVTIAATSYFIKFDDQIYSRISGFARLFERFAVKQRNFHYRDEQKKYEVVLIGADRMGYSIIRSLKKQKKDFFVIDFNPDIIKRLARQDIHCMYGDIGDVDIVEHLKLQHAKLVISTIPDVHENILLLKKIKKVNQNTTVILSANYVDDALQLYDEGADYVIIPHFLGGEHMSILLEEKALDLDKLINTKLEHIKELKNRRELHPRHR